MGAEYKLDITIHNELYNLNIHKTNVHLHRILHMNAARDQNAVTDSKIN
jgi:hypothetical protein